MRRTKVICQICGQRNADPGEGLASYSCGNCHNGNGALERVVDTSDELWGLTFLGALTGACTFGLFGLLIGGAITFVLAKLHIAKRDQ